MGSTLARTHGFLAGDVGCLDRSLVWPWPWADEAVARIRMPAEARDAVRGALADARRVVEAGGLVVQLLALAG